MREVVLLHGWGSTGTIYDDLSRALASRHVVHVLPLEGLGTLAEAARNMAARAPRCCAVVGWSLGAQIAIEWALGYPTQVERLVLIAATPSFVRRDAWPYGVDREVFTSFAQALERDPARTLTRFHSLQAQGDAHSKPVVRALRSAQAPAGDSERLRAGLHLLAASDQRERVKSVRQSTLLIHGEADALVPRGAAEMLCRTLPKARCEIVCGAGHVPFVSDKAGVAEMIREFLDE